MGKSFFYLSTRGTKSPKIKKVLKDYGPRGAGLFIFLAEEICNNGNTMEIDDLVSAVQNRVREQSEVIRAVAQNYGLFGVDGDVISIEANEIIRPSDYYEHDI